MSARGNRVGPWLTGALATVMALASVPLLAMDWPLFRGGGVEPIWATVLVQVVAPIWSVLVLSALSGFILSRQARSPLGRIYAVWALLLAFTVFMQEYAVRALIGAPGSLPAGELAAWIGAWSSPGTGLLMFPMALAVLLFPDGRLPGTAWWLAAGIVLVVTAGNLLASLGSPFLLTFPMREGVLPVTMPPPLWEVGSALDGWPVEALGWANLLFVPLIAVLFLHRTWRARGDERFQLRWLAYALAIAAVCWLAWQAPRGSDESAQAIARWGQLGAIFTGLVVVPLAMAIAIFKYRLYDIDVLINRTLVYGAVSATLGATYVVAVVVLQGLLRPLTIESEFAGSEFAVALSTLLVVALFQPIRSRAQDAVDRRFYRARYDAARTIDAFSARLRADVDLDSVRADLVGVIHETVHPAHASVWLRGGK
jgi:hypothetical protein